MSPFLSQNVLVGMTNSMATLSNNKWISEVCGARALNGKGCCPSPALFLLCPLLSLQESLNLNLGSTSHFFPGPCHLSPPEPGAESPAWPWVPHFTRYKPGNLAQEKDSPEPSVCEGSLGLCAMPALSRTTPETWGGLRASLRSGLLVCSSSSGVIKWEMGRPWMAPKWGQGCTQCR